MSRGNVAGATDHKAEFALQILFVPRCFSTGLHGIPPGISSLPRHDNPTAALTLGVIECSINSFPERRTRRAMLRGNRNCLRIQNQDPILSGFKQAAVTKF